MRKRIFDLSFAIIGLVILCPLFIFVAILIKLDSKGEVFFRQTRVGRFGQPFRIHKFRTMRSDTERHGLLTVGHDSRITRIGHLLRRSKFDELPQLLDVLVGNMSFVGPRPEVQEFIDCYPPEIRSKVLSVRPGITDKASIEMVDENEILAQYQDPKQAYIDFILPIKQRYYLEYVENNSLIIDVKIIFRTLLKIVVR